MTVQAIEDIKSRRKKLRLSQAALSTAADLQDNYVCRLEGGEFREPSFSKMMAIMRALDAAEAEAAKPKQRDDVA